jgi:hypothetical protein
VEEWTSWLPEHRWRALDTPSLESLLDLDDPAGRIDPADLSGLTYAARSLSDASLDEALAFHADCVLPRKFQDAGFGYTLATGDLTVNSPRGTLSNVLLILRDRSASGGEASEGDVDRRILRVLLKVLGFADALVESEAGRPALRVREDEAWRDVELPARVSSHASADDAPAAATQVPDPIRDAAEAAPR